MSKIYYNHHLEGMLVQTDFTSKNNLIGIVIECNERWCLSKGRQALLITFFAQNKFYEDWVFNLNLIG